MDEDNQEVMHEQAVEVADDEVKLSDGRIVKMRETTGADDAAVAQMLGDKISLQGAGGAVFVQANALKAVVSVDGVPAPIMQNYRDFIKFSRTFKTRDMNRIASKYAQMNLEANEDNPLA
ncbi:hypothetical protein LLE49_19525 [Alicyclobacillus tolerans]|uniref:hypothetical protein n=1 Tax=Alicyclobacillus tolerans TaxID=90970 RepID=UPI001F454470|nr:hypothetical protein [Alicyclobacillus tolerans]MCF8566913.1 hypothetical protein [Alicyclobacillus tolerans]